ncbi:MAG: RtcB family protein [Caldisericaceae bacterium]|nr:RtcB family protein [Caldisericaceae bacterium]
MGKSKIPIEKIDDNLFEIKPFGGMLKPGRIYASDEMIAGLLEEEAPLQQVINVAHLPGIEKYSLAMPDIHWGYGFPIGGVAATDWKEGVISPGGVGYDINCGMRLAATGLTESEVKKRLQKLVEELFKTIPTGVGASHAIKKLSKNELKKVAQEGVNLVVEQGFGQAEDIEVIEEKGKMEFADFSVISQRAIERGLDQLGTLGSGNHFLEIDVVDKIYDEEKAAALGLFQGQIVILIHTGSRGFGYQICDDYLKVMSKAAQKYHLNLPDRQLAAAPIQSQEGQDYFAAMSCAANFAWSNRQVIMDLARRVFKKVFNLSDADLQFRLIYDVSHNIAKKEEHQIGDKKKTVCVHRKGATRALAPNHPLLPEKYRTIGQPVLIPGDMGRYSFVCIGTEKAMEETFGSTCHGAGRLLSRRQAKKAGAGRNLIKELSERGVIIQAKGMATVAEEMPEAYKDVQSVVNVMHNSGISLKVARLKPIGVIKG